jgi:hypothetical protein
LLVFLLVLNLCLGADKLVIFLARATLHLAPALVGLSSRRAARAACSAPSAPARCAGAWGRCWSSRSARRRPAWLSS